MTAADDNNDKKPTTEPQAFAHPSLGASAFPHPGAGKAPGFFFLNERLGRIRSLLLLLWPRATRTEALAISRRGAGCGKASQLHFGAGVAAGPA